MSTDIIVRFTDSYVQKLGDIKKGRRLDVPQISYPNN